MSNPDMTESWDDAWDGAGLAAGLVDDMFQLQWHIQVTAGPDRYPNEKAFLSPAAARALAAHLNALAAEADERQAEQRCQWDVEMVCTACRKPVGQTCGYGPIWYHLTDDDVDGCPTRGQGPIKAMVAAGNEKIPFDLAKPAMSGQLDA